MTPLTQLDAEVSAVFSMLQSDPILSHYNLTHVAREVFVQPCGPVYYT